MSLAIESLFNKNRFVGGPSLLFIILYAPLGIILFTLRIFISLQLCVASLVLPSGTLIRKFVLRVLFTVMGIVVRETNWQNKDEKCCIIVSNHITPFDHLAISLVYPCISVNVYNLPAPLSTILCYKDFGVTRGRDILRNNIQTYLSQPNAVPLLLHPEGATTNGKVALMKYGTWTFEFDSTVMVLGLEVHRIPFLPIATTVLGSSWAADLFYALFSPATIYNIKYIGKLSKQESESVNDFALRAQKSTASALNLQTSSHNVADKVEYIKRLAREEAAASNPFLNPEIHSMSLQVKEVLPYLPLEIIKRDIIRTRNVDMTITNFLEGNIPEPIPSVGHVDAITTLANSSTISTAETISSSSETSTVNVLNVTLNSTIDTQNLNMAAKSFAKSAHERMLSFHERKSQLIEKARLKYINKHNLKIPGVNC